NGTIRVAGTLYASDRRYKKNIEPLENSLDALLNLRGVTYEWNREQWKDRNFSAGKQIGLIAQEVEAIFPELVKSDADGYKSVNYVSLVPVTIEAIKAQQKEIEALKTKNSELEARLAAIEKLLLKKK
ncbi:MAG: tail fiber domain-containing protein, partial [Chthonomonadaceae bacterium]|nr:tail fiber domain-containing protein [Chthonomonadaceae bacterium]